MYVPSDSSSDEEVQYVATHHAPKTPDTLSDHVRITLQQLELQNAILALPNFSRKVSFSPDDQAVATALADMRRARLRTKSSNILILTTSVQRGRRWHLLLSTYTELQPFIHFPERPSELHRVSRKHDVVIAHTTHALMSAKYRRVFIQSLALLVIDAAEQVVDRAHATAVLIRDYYRALPERLRPRILAIARAHVSEPAMHPLEYNLLSRFISVNVTRGVRWPSSFGKGSRPAEAGLIDLEYLYYHPSSVEANEMFSVERRRSMPSMPAHERDRRAYSEIDHLVEQVGPLGVAAYEKMKQLRRERHINPGKLLPDKLTIADRDALVGLNSKALSLINEIHLAYAASTRSDRLAAIVYAGRPVVACALCELVRAFPIFRGLCARVALGVHSAAAYHKENLRNEFQDAKWQGEDTDDEEVSSFSAGETNVLFVANQYCSQKKPKRPLPPTPLVLRFDGSQPDPELDGGGGRCRVVVFREHEAKRYAHSTKKLGSSPTGNTGTGSEAAASPAKNEVPDRNPVENAIASTKREHGRLSPKANIANGSSSKTPARSIVQPQRVLPSLQGLHELSEDENYVYHSAPAKPLRGPHPDSDSPVFLYRIMLFNELPKSRIEELEKAKDSGVEDFLLVLSSKIADRDTIISIADIDPGTGNGSSTSGYLKLDYQGTFRLTTDQIIKARQYTEQMFCLLLPYVHNGSFVWDNIPMQNGRNSEQNSNRADRCRKYLVLPGKNQPSQSLEDGDLEIVTSTTQPVSKPEELSPSVAIVSRYFSHDASKSRPKRVLGPREIDWDTVEALLNLCDKENYREEARKSFPLASDEFHEHEGKLVFSTISGGIFAMSGRLRYDLTPLTQITRSRKFPLNDDGTFVEHDDLAYLIDVVVSEQTLEKQSKANLSKAVTHCDSEDSKGGDSNRLDSKTESNGIAAHKTDEAKGTEAGPLSPAKWCHTRKRLISDTTVLGKRKRTSGGEMKFDCDRNVKKKRKTWVGRVKYSLETYFNKYYDSPIRILDQPLLETSRHQTGSVENLVELLRGTSMAALCERFVASGTEKHLLVPELVRAFPLSVGAVFLPASLHLIEKHLSVCELRAFFDVHTKSKGTVSELLQAVTSSAVNSSKNYERLELLGDSVLKLSCTVRLFAKHPHYTEGQMHHARAHLVSNARLHRRGEQRGIFNYVRFQTETSMDWFPPGTDLDGRAQRLNLKGLADVVEALCGVYFLFGSRTDSRKKEYVEVLNDTKNETESDWEVDLTYDSFAEDSDNEDEEPHAVTNNSENGNSNTGASRSFPKHKSKRINHFNPLSANSVEKGYVAGYRFLQICKVFDDNEPSHSEILLSAAHAMLRKGSKAPQEVNEEAFPRDDRLLRPAKPWEEEYGLLEEHIGYKFKRRHLLLCAVTHGSYIKKDHMVVGNEQTFQRLEFLGDAVADFCVVRYLYEKYPELGPGELTALKGNVVSNEAFARTSVALGLHKFLCHASIAMTEEVESYIGTVTQDLTVDKELGAHGGFKRSLGEIAAPKVLGDIFEAIIGAIFVDSGLQQAWRVCMRLLGDSLRINADPLRQDMHPCTELSEMATGVWKLAQQPKYDTRDQRRPHQKEGDAKARLGSRKVASVYIMNEKVAEGHGSTIKRAKLKAAVAAMKVLKDSDPESRGGKLLRKLKEKSVRQQIAERRFSRG